MSILTYDEMREGFTDPSSEYGPIDCWWWETGLLDKEKMRWQLEEMKRKGVSGTWYYPRFAYGEPFGSKPAYWSDEWWDLFRWSMNEHRRLGLVAWTNDWTVHEFTQSKLLNLEGHNPNYYCNWLKIHEKESKEQDTVVLEVPDNEKILWASAFRKVDGGLDGTSRRDLDLVNRRVEWKAPDEGWVVTIITTESHDLNYLDREVVEKWIHLLLGTHEEKLSGFLGTVLQAFGTDEWLILRGKIAFSDALVDRFEDEKGYNPLPHLAGLFHDIGDYTDKIRCDYYDILVQMLEENLYEPIVEWLHERGMKFVDFCPFGKDMDLQTQTQQYGDYYRYLRSYDIPGNEWGNSGTNRFHAKLASSIAHVNGRKRVGLCGYWATGWGHNQEENLRLTNENYAYGINLYNRHGAIYNTLGGWYEWVPPAIHFRQPYWQSWKVFADHIRRLSYVLSQGTHVADVAILYPITTIHAAWTGGDRFSSAADEASDFVHRTAYLIFKKGIDLEFIDHQSLCKADLSGGRIRISGLELPVLILPPMTTIRTDTLRKIKEFYEAGGIVIAYRRLPTASPDSGRNDPNIRHLLGEIFGIDNTGDFYHQGSFQNRFLTRENSKGGKAIFMPSNAPESIGGRNPYIDLPGLLSNLLELDVISSGDGDIYHTHQKIRDSDIFFIVNTGAEKRKIEFSVRVVGEPEIWDTLSGEIRPVFRFEKLDGRTKVRLQMEAYQGVILVFRTTSGRPEVLEDSLTQIDDVSVSTDVIEVRGWSENGGKAEVKLRYGKRYSSRIRVDPPPTEIALDGQWGFKLRPTMDNRWGDFRYPPSPNFIGPEARSFCYMEEGELSGTDRGWNERDFDDSSWPIYTFSFGPYWWSIGPLEEGQESRNLLEKAIRGEIETKNWHHYNFSQKFGHEDVETHSVWGGILGVSDNFLVFDSTKSGAGVNRYLFTFVISPEDREYILDFGGEEVFPREAWVNGEKVISVSKGEKTRVSREARKSKFVEKLSLVEPARKEVRLKKGTNHVLLKLVQPGGEKVSTYASFYYLENPPEDKFQVPLLKWFRKTDLTFDIMPHRDGVIGWYRFEAPPGLRSITLPIRARDVQVWVNGNRAALNEDRVELTSPIEGVSQIALRVSHLPGKYAGAAFHEPVKFECDWGLINLGDWCDSALENYSGAAIYRTTVDLQPKHMECRATLDLGEVNSTAELWVNGKHAGIRLAQPYRYQITDLLQKGKNRLEVKVHNTLANHYSKGYPTKFVYNGQALSGLIGPVKLEFLREIHISISQDK